jgi:hypothetical protein
MWFGSNGDIVVTRRANRDDPWGLPVAEVALDAPGSDEVAGNVDALGTTIVFASDRRGSWDIFRATRSDRMSSWDAPQLVAAVSTDAFETSPWIHPDGLTLYFHRAADFDAAEDRDIYVSTRNSRSDAFGVAVPVDELNTPNDDTDPWFLGDYSYGVMARGKRPRELFEIVPEG